VNMYMDDRYKVPTMDEVHKLSSQEKFNVISLFAGMGGSSTGYRMAGAKILAVNEFMKAARSIYNRNYPDTYIFPDDIRTLNGVQMLKKLGLKVGELDLLDGSPPCASFSMAGKRKKMWGEVKGYSSTKQRVDDLFYEFSRILKDMQPKTFIAENVKGLALGDVKALLGNKGKGLENFFGKARNVGIIHEKDNIIKTLRACGYKVSYKVLNSIEFGVPQIRERLIFVGVRDDLGMSPSFPEGNKGFRQRPIKAGDVMFPFIFNGCERNLTHGTKEWDYIHNWFKPLTTLHQVTKIAKKNNLKAFCQRMPRDNWFYPHRTILQSDYNIHALVNRYTAVNESKLLQSFPSDFDVLGQPFKRIKVSVNDLLKKKFNCYNFQAGQDSGDIPYICSLVDFPKERWDEKCFYLDLKEPEIKVDTKSQYYNILGHSKSNEFVGRAVPPLLMKAVAEHVYEKIISKI